MRYHVDSTSPGFGEYVRTGVAFVSHIGAAEKKRAAPTGLA